MMPWLPAMQGPEGTLKSAHMVTYMCVKFAGRKGPTRNHSTPCPWQVFKQPNRSHRLPYEARIYSSKTVYDLEADCHLSVLNVKQNAEHSRMKNVSSKT